MIKKISSEEENKESRNMDEKEERPKREYKKREYKPRTNQTRKTTTQAKDSQNKTKTQTRTTTKRTSSTRSSTTKSSVARNSTTRTSTTRTRNTANYKNNENNNTQESKFRFKKSPLKIIPLGGLLEVGKNITVFEYENEIIIVDCGLAFPEDDMLGVDLVIPDITYLERNKSKIKGLVITHGHEDHIGAIPYLLKQIDMPIYATRLTIGLISNKLEEHGLLRKTKLHTVNQGDTVKFGKLQVEFIRSCHSIPDAVALGIHTPVGTVIHTGDFKIDYTPIDDERIRK